MSSVEEAAVAAARRLADSCTDILQTTLVSVVLHGSLTMDDFRPGRSDIDLLIVVERGLTSSEADALVGAVRAADLGPAGGVDLLVVTRRTAEKRLLITPVGNSWSGAGLVQARSGKSKVTTTMYRTFGRNCPRPERTGARS